jgi:hypothetical protein
MTRASELPWLKQKVDTLSPGSPPESAATDLQLFRKSPEKRLQGIGKR